MKHASWLTAGALLLALAACGGKQSHSELSVAPLPEAALDSTLRAALPVLPAAGEFALNRMTAAPAQEAMLDGSSAEDSLLAELNLDSARWLDLNSTANAPAYALYRFNAVPGEQIDGLQVKFAALPAGEEAYIALGNYSTGRWEFFAPATALATSLDLSPTAAYTSPVSGALYVFVACFGGVNATVESVSLNFPNRHGVSGQVVDKDGNPLPGVQIGAGILGQTATTDAAGNFTLGGLPDGNWLLTATAHRHTFWPNPQPALVAGADSGGLVFTGHINGAHNYPTDRYGFNNNRDSAVQLDLQGAVAHEALSAIDDQRDCFRISLPGAGSYLVQFRDQEQEIFYPKLEARSLSGKLLANSATPLSGAVCVPLVSAAAGSEVLIEITCAGGCGDYELELFSEPTAKLESKITLAGEGLGAAQLEAIEQLTGHKTIYMMPPVSFPGASIADAYRREYKLALTPLSPHYTYTPASINAILYDADVLDANFTATALPLGDSNEPNSGRAGADSTPALVLPYNSAGSVELSIGAGDSSDWYRCTPAAGKGMRVEAFFPGTLDIPAFVTIYDNDSRTTPVAQSSFHQGRVCSMLETAADGGVYYIGIEVLSAAHRKLPYELRVTTYDGFALELEAQFEGAPLPNTKFEVMLQDFGIKRQLQASTTGRTAPLLLEAGAPVFIEAFRYGASFDRNTRLIAMPSSDHVVVFNALDADSADSFEPNDNLATAPSITSLPATIAATFDTATDFSDGFRVFLSSPDPVTLTLSEAQAGSVLTVQVMDSTGVPLHNFDLPAGQSRSFDPQGQLELWIGLVSSLTHPDYSMSVSQGAAYVISGSVLEAGNPVEDCLLHCVESGETVEADALGSYAFSPLSPGSYEIVCWAAGYSSSPDPATVAVVNAAVTQDFSLTLDASAENYEPNDSLATATLLPADDSLSLPCTVGRGSDGFDFFRFQAVVGSFVRVRLEWEEPWYFDPRIPSVNSPTHGSMGPSFNSGLGYQEVVFLAPESGIYNFQVNTLGKASSYRVRILRSL